MVYQHYCCLKKIYVNNYNMHCGYAEAGKRLFNIVELRVLQAVFRRLVWLLVGKCCKNNCVALYSNLLGDSLLLTVFGAGHGLLVLTVTFSNQLFWELGQNGNG